MAKRAVLVTAVLASSMAFIDGTVVNVALPAIQHDLQASAAQMQWVVEGYALLLAALLLVGGALGDRYGRRRVFLCGVAVFVVASGVCGLARDVGQLVLARCAQGAGAALVVPGSLALISATFPEQERGRAIGTWSGFSGITAALGPVLGGFLIDHYAWSWAFYINLPLGIAVLALAAWRVPESRAPSASSGAPLDWAGAVLATAALGGCVYAFIEAQAIGWHAPRVWGALAAGIVATLLFVVTERRVRAPMLPLPLFRNRDFAGANLLTLFLYAALGGALYFLPLNLIQVQGYGAAAAGAALLPFIAILFLFSRWAGTLVEKAGPRRPLVIGPAIAAAGFALLAVPGSGGVSYWTAFFPAVVVLGVGMTITIAPLTTTVMNALGADLAGTASGVNNAISRAAAVVAIAVFGTLLAGVFGQRVEFHLHASNVPPGIAAAVHEQRARLAGIEMPQEADAPTRAAVTRAVGAAYVDGFRPVMLVSAALALASSVVAAMMIGRGGERRPVKDSGPKLRVLPANRRESGGQGRN